jgi:hypothetical protein
VIADTAPLSAILTNKREQDRLAAMMTTIDERFPEMAMTAVQLDEKVLSLLRKPSQAILATRRSPKSGLTRTASTSS